MVKKTPETSVWFIRHKETQELWKAPSGKTSWRKKGHAKNAWATIRGIWNSAEHYGTLYGVPLLTEYHSYSGEERKVFPKFDEQDVYELVEINNVAGDLVDSLKQIIEQMIEHLPEDKKELYSAKYKEIEA